MSYPVISAHLDDDGQQVILRERRDDGVHERRVPAEYVSFHRVEDLGRERRRQLKSFDIVKGIREEGSWVRISWAGDGGRRAGRGGMRDNEVETFEGDLDPVLLYLVESKVPIAKPRRCYLDLEADSRVSLAQKEKMRILSWAVVDHETGAERVGVLDSDIEDEDEAEEQLLTHLVDVLGDYEQICIWEGDWKGGEFDSVVLPARARRCGIDFDERRWIWTNQLAVWKKMNQHSAESGDEKESFKLEDIAFAQLGEGKEATPDFVRERFPELSAKGLGAMTWELYEAGGVFRDLLVKYNARDAQLLRKLEMKKSYLTLFQSTCEACGIFAETRSLQPTRQMDGFMLRLGRARDHRFPTKSFREDSEIEEAKETKYKGAFVYHPRTVASRKDDGEVWTAEEARAWRVKHGMRNGILRNVHVVDFASLYPSIMMTYNLSADVVLGFAKSVEQAKERYGEKVIWSPGNGLVTRGDVVGLLPLALAELIRLRKEYAELAASLPPGSPEWQDAMSKSTAFKVIANSFYGAGGSPFSRFYNRDVSEACTQNAVHYLKMTVAEATARAMSVVYGDTDSVFVIGPTEEGYKRFTAWLNAKRFPKEVADHGCPTNYVKLTFEKTFERLVFVSAKAYVGRYVQYKGTPASRECHGLVRQFKGGAFGWYLEKEKKHDGETCPTCGSIGKLADEPEIKGLAWKRGDKGKLARELQGRGLDALVGGVKVRGPSGGKIPINADLGLSTPTDDVAVFRELVERAQKKVIDEPLSLEDVRFSKALSKSLREYGKDATEPHVRVAQILKERDVVVGKGTRIEYVVVDASATPQAVIPATDFTGDCDRFHLWERVYSPMLSLLEAAFPDDDWSRFEVARPAKAREKKVDERQLGLAIDVPRSNVIPFPKKGETKKLAADDELAVTAYRSSDLVVRIPESAGKEAIDRVGEVFKAHPGARRVRVVIVLESGAEAVLQTKAYITPGPRFKEALDAAIRAPAPAP